MTATVVGAPSRVRRIDSATGVPTLPRKDPTGRNGRSVGRQDLVAEQKPRLMRRGAFDHAGHECPPPIVGLGEGADAGIAHLAVREDMQKPSSMLKGAGENVGELVIGRVVRRVIARVRGAERGQHRIDHRGELLPRARRLGLRTVARAHSFPVEPMQARVVETVAHELPDLVERRAVRFVRTGALRLRLRLGADGPRPEGERGCNCEKVPARCFHRFRLLSAHGVDRISLGRNPGPCLTAPRANRDAPCRPLSFGGRSRRA